jgi:LysM repeat protein
MLYLIIKALTVMRHFYLLPGNLDTSKVWIRDSCFLLDPEKVEEAKSETEKAGSKPAATKNYKIYKVRRGDTLWKIAVSNGMTLEEIRKLNGFKSNVKIQVGQKIKVKG